MSEYARERSSSLLMSSRISTSLCRIIFQLPKANDSLWLMTILSTDLTALRQCGYDSTSSTTFIFIRLLTLLSFTN
jgi:hypothetical protein